MAAKIGIVYGAGSKMIRRVIVPGDDKELGPAHVGVGEFLLIVDRTQIVKHEDITLAVEIETGVKPPDPLCAIVGGDQVVGFVLADPAIDALPGKEIVHLPSKEITIGSTYDAVKDEFTIPVKVIPSFVDENGAVVPEESIPAKTVKRDGTITDAGVIAP